MLKVEYVRTFDDYVDYVRHKSRGLSSIQGIIYYQRTVLMVVFLTAAVAMAYLIDKPLVVVEFNLLLLLACVVFWMRVPKNVWAKVNAATRSNVADLGIETTTVELVLTEETLVMAADGMRIEVRWDRMQGVEVVGDSTYINLAAGMAALVPRDGFEEERDYFAVRRFALRKLGGELPRDE